MHGRVGNISVMSNGEVKELGTHQELMQQNGIYSELVRLQGGSADGKETMRKKKEKVASVESGEKAEEVKEEKKAEEELKNVSLTR